MATLAMHPISSKSAFAWIIFGENTFQFEQNFVTPFEHGARSNENLIAKKSEEKKQGKQWGRMMKTKKQSWKAWDIQVARESENAS